MDSLAQQAQEAAREESWLRDMVAELSALDPKAGEETELLELRKRAQTTQASLGALKQAMQLLTESDGAALQLRQVSKLLAKAPIEASAMAALERAENDIEEVSVAIERVLQAAEIDPLALERAEDRLHALRDAGRKFKVAVELLPDTLKNAQEKLSVLTNLDAETKKAQAALTQAEKDYKTTAQALYEARGKAGEKMVKAVMKELAPLKMASTQLRVVQAELPPQSWGEAGIHQVSFEVATNAGMPFGSLGKVASGGELSRLLLAMKVVLQTQDEVSSIFDEIDTGTGGAVAEAIGLRLKQLSQTSQVMVVTHAPQVAALADHHLFISKSGTKEVVTKITVLDKAERKEELARMLSGATISDEARKAAGKLLQAAS